MFLTMSTITFNCGMQRTVYCLVSSTKVINISFLVLHDQCQLHFENFSVGNAEFQIFILKFQLEQKSSQVFESFFESILLNNLY